MAVRVIEQARLWFREGTSDKVYEVDLIELAPNQHVVNFRFGRRGSVLRDGTKTATPVPLAKARALYDKLVAEKTAGGYRPTEVAPPATAPPPAAAAPSPPAGDADAQLIARLARGNRGEDPLGPHVWRAADRDLRAAEPVLLELLDSAPPRHVVPAAWQHSVLSALVRCGGPASLARLSAVVRDAKVRPFVRDVARLAIVRIDPARALELARPGLPPALLAALDQRAPEAVAHAAEELLAADPAAAHAAAVSLYLIDTAAPGAASVARAGILAMARVARLSNAEAATVRALFRLAELRRDPALYARLARRIDTHHGYNRPFGALTRQYFRRRVARVLRRLARAGSADYVAMASAVLMSVTQADAQPVRASGYGEHYDRFARWHALNDILYSNSPRYERAHPKRSAWQSRGKYRPGDPAPAAREERYTQLWDRAPEALWRLMLDAACDPVVEFAARALGDHRGYLEAMSDAVLAEVLATGHRLAQQRVFGVVRDRPLTITLARGALASELPDAHAWVLRWIDAHPSEAIADPELIAVLVTGPTAEVRDVALQLLRGRRIADDVARSAAMRAIAILIGLPDTAGARATASVALLLRVLEAPLLQIGAEILRDLIGHPLVALGELAGEIMLRHAARDRLPVDLIEAMLQSPHAVVRTLGGRMLALTPPEIAKDDLEALVMFATSGNQELRDATRALLGEVARRFPEVGRALAERLVDALLQPQLAGAPAHMVSLLGRELAGLLPRRDPATILRLIGALSPHAREAGGLLLPQLDADDLGLDDLVRLASHEMIAIRHGAWALARAAVPRFKLAPVAIARLIDSRWDDTRAFATALVRDELAPLSADAIIAICDSIRPEVQALGQQMLFAQFQAGDAGHYVVRLAEHPSPSIQLLVSTLLEQYLGAEPVALDRLRTLVPYLVTVLSQVNRGKVAKARVIALLRREAARSAEAAAIVAPVLDRQSATAAITQKHPLIAAMVELAHQFPEVAVPITVIPPAPHAAERAAPDDEAAP